MLAKCVETIRDILFNSPNSIPPGGKVGIITFDKDVHFYNLQVFYIPDFFKIYINYKLIVTFLIEYVVST